MSPLEELIDSGYLEKAAAGLVLTDEGYNFLNTSKVNRRKRQASVTGTILF